MTMERRKPKNLAHSQSSQSRFKAEKTGTTPHPDFKLEVQTNSWLRISLAAKKSSKKFTNLFCHFTVANLREAFHAIDGSKATYQCIKESHVVEIDLRSFFNTVSHRKLMRLIGLKITDPRIHSLTTRFLKVGIMNQAGELEGGKIGTPRGSIMGPVLANVFLHYFLDEWFVKSHASKGGYIVRCADDAVFVLDQKEKAQKFKEALVARLEKYELTLNEDKSGIISFGKQQGNVFNFLGFTFFWSKDHAAERKSLRVKTSRKVLFKKSRNRLKLDDPWKLSAAKLRGHYQYYGVHTNRPKLNHFYYAVVGNLFKWLNRRSQRKSFTWEKFAKRLLHYSLPMPPQVASLTKLGEKRIYAH